MKKILAFIGAGKMATAIGSGLAKHLPELSIRAWDPVPAAREAFQKATGGTPARSMQDAVENADIVLLAVKPQYVPEALAEAKPFFRDPLFLSIAAGITLSQLASMTGLKRIIRIMPNTPALAGEAMSCFSPLAGVAETDIQDAEAILKAVGRCRRVNENLLKAVTGLSGSGPAYVFEFIMALADGGVYEGLSRDVALELAVQTVLGSAKLVLDQGTDKISALRDAVISPAGTTSRGIAALDEGAFRSTVVKAVTAAADYAEVLARGK